MDVGLAYFEIKDTTSECNSWIQLIWGVHELNSYGRPVHEREVVSYSWALAEWLISSLVTKDLRGGRVIPQSGHQTISKDFAISNLFAHFCHLQRSKMSDEEDLDKETIGRKVKIQNAADAATMSGATVLARGMNTLVFTNHLIMSFPVQTCSFHWLGIL